jgi:hypothetical protein
MKGKKKLLFMLFAIVTLVATGVVFALNGKVENIKYAQALEVAGYSAELEDGVIFSAERVYFAQDTQQPLTYKNEEFNKIYNND